MHIIKKNKFVKIVLFEKKYITQKFVNRLNSKSVNKYLDIRKSKQSIKSSLIFYENLIKNGDYYLAILNDKNHLIGTITLRKINKKRFNEYWSDNKLKWNNHIIYIGFMISMPKYFGTKISKDSFQMGLNFAFNQLKAKMVLAGTDKRNASSNFNLMRNGFKLYKKTTKDFYFMLKR